MGSASRGYAYEYDRAGNRTKKTETGNGEDKVTEYAYDSLNRLSEVTEDDGTCTEYSFDEWGNITEKAYYHPDDFVFESGDVTEEDILPVLSDTSVWERTMNVSATENSVGKQVYTSEYGKVTVDAPGESPVVYPKSFKFTGTVTATLCDSEMNEICTVKCEA